VDFFVIPCISKFRKYFLKYFYKKKKKKMMSLSSFLKKLILYAAFELSFYHFCFNLCKFQSFARGDGSDLCVVKVKVVAVFATKERCVVTLNSLSHHAFGAPASCNPRWPLSPHLPAEVTSPAFS